MIGHVSPGFCGGLVIGIIRARKRARPDLHAILGSEIGSTIPVVDRCPHAVAEPPVGRRPRFGSRRRGGARTTGADRAGRCRQWGILEVWQPSVWLNYLLCELWAMELAAVIHCRYPRLVFVRKAPSSI